MEENFRNIYKAIQTLFSSAPVTDYLFQKDTIFLQMITGFRKISEISAADTGSETYCRDYSFSILQKNLNGHFSAD